MEVAEVYRAPQGEGVNIGLPSVFVRLQGCPVGCNWCDTKFTWPMKSAESFEVTPAELAERIRSVAGPHIVNIVITGGEPLAQRKDLQRLVNILDREFNVEIETSGVYKPLASGDIQYNVSPKLLSAQSKLKPAPVLKEYIERVSFFKFVIRDEDDLAEARKVCDKYDLPYHRVYLMPEGIDSQTIIKGTRWLEQQIMEKWPQVRLTTRLHILMHENARKV